MKAEESSFLGVPRNPLRDEFIADEAAWSAAEDFKRLKFDERIKKIWEEKFANNPPAFFEDTAFLASLPTDHRLVLLARASLHITVTPSLAGRYFTQFPNDRNAVAALIIESGGIAEDGITHMLFGLVWHVVQDITHPSSQRRNGDQYNEIAARRELAPRHLLSNHQEGGLHLVERFGDAAKGYENAAREAHRLAIHGDSPLDTSDVFSSDAYHELSGDKKAEFLRACLDDMQFALVFEETFNSAFTEKSVADNNRRTRTPRVHSDPEINAFLQKMPTHNPAHSMLFGTWQSQGTYNLRPDFFEREMRNTAAIGGAIEEYAHHKLLLLVLHEFKNVPADADRNTDLLVEFWIKNKNPIFANMTVEALRSQNSHRAAELLFQSLRDDSGNRSAIANILRRVDDGPVLLKNIAEIAQLLENEETPERFFADTMSQLKKSGKLTLEDVQGSTISVVSGSELRGELRRAAQMENILVKTDTSMYPKGFATKLEHQFKGLHGDPNARFYTFEWQGQVVSFMTFADRETKPHPVKGSLREVYFGFFRTSEKFKGGKIGEALLEVALQREIERLAKEDKPFYILAYCDPKAPVTQKYLALGFAVIRSFTTPEGVDRFEIRLDPENYYARRERASS